MFLSKQRNGVYYVYYYNSNGNRKCKSTKEKNKAKALQFLTAFKKYLEEESERKVKEISLEHFLLKFLAYSETIHSMKHTYSIRSTFNELQKYYGNIYLEELTKEKLQSYLEFRLRKLSAYTIRRDIANFSSAFEEKCER